MPARLDVMVVAAMLAVAAGPGRAAEYYVAPNGSDSNPGTLQLPKQDPKKIAAQLGPGDTLYFRAGEYACTTNSVIGLGPARSGQPGMPITFRNYQNEHVKIDCSGSDWGFTPNGCSWVVIDGFEIVNGTHFGMKIAANQGNGKQFGEHVTIRNCDVHDTGMECIFALGTPFLTIENCHLHDSLKSHGLYINASCHNAVVRNVTSENNRGNSGIQVNAAGGGSKDVLVERCLLRGNAQGFSLMGAINGTFRNNVVFNDGFDGPRGSGWRELILWTYAAGGGTPGTLCEGNVFENNTFVNLVPPGHKLNHIVHSKSGTKDSTFRNNIFVVRGKPLFTLESFEGFVFENNCLFNVGGGVEVEKGGSLAQYCREKGLKESATISADPMFVDPEKGDLRLRNGSPCIDTGVKTTVKDKTAGRGRDIGALEKGAEVPIGCDLPWKKPAAKPR